MAITSQKQSNTTLVAHHAQISKTTKYFVRNYQRIMQNKPNFRRPKMNVSFFYTKDYENKSNWTLGQNKPNSNPIRQACVVCEGVAGLIKANFRSNDCKLLCCRVLVPLNEHIDIIYQRFFASDVVIILNL